ncbi:MAG: ABC transporter ATP-binding protein [Oscillospiraceae bacterium]|nr:ABC transporter ATP-binding protein [Oscillospiraceae bacterium]
MAEEYAVKMVDITKTFGAVTANDRVHLELKKGEILSLLGENGSGKTTLMNMLSGIYFPDSGHIFVDGQEVTIASPHDAYTLGIGMVHQHFKLVDVLTAAENIELGLPGKLVVDKKAIGQRIREICDRYGFVVEPEKKVYDMSVSEKQTLEIVKALYRGANVLILDEPTAVLTPQETERLFAVMRNMKADGKSIIIITHKLHEVLEISDRVAVLRKGAYVGDMATAGADTQTLSDMMVGRAVDLNIDRADPENIIRRLELRHLTVKDADGVLRLDDISLDVNGGEILGVAGISGCGQKELLEAIAGLQETEDGSSIKYFPQGAEGPAEELIGQNPRTIADMGIRLAFVPEDRLGMGLVGSMDLADNMMLKSYREGRGAFTDRKPPHKLAESVVEELEVVTPSISTPVRRLSGGNVQKVLVGREIAAQPTVLLSAYAVRGLDINTSYTIYRLLNEQKQAGVAVLYVGEDLDVLLELCDRIAVLCGGRLSGILDARTATKEQVGFMMTNVAGTGREEGKA